MGSNARLTVDLPRQVVIRPDGEEVPFEIDAFRKHLLLEGLDDIGQTLNHEASIATFEKRLDQDKSWLPTIHFD